MQRCQNVEKFNNAIPSLSMMPFAITEGSHKLKCRVLIGVLPKKTRKQYQLLILSLNLADQAAPTGCPSSLRQQGPNHAANIAASQLCGHRVRGPATRQPVGGSTNTDGAEQPAGAVHASATQVSSMHSNSAKPARSPALIHQGPRPQVARPRAR